MRIGIVAAEPSGDLLASGLMRALQAELPGVEFEGVAGPLMQQCGVDTWEPMESLSVMGLVEVLRHLPRLLRLRSRLLSRWLETPPAVFIGVDAPDFNLELERRLRDAGVPTVHYVCPTVWAWRSGRVKKIRAAVDLLLTIFPFEKRFLDAHQVRSRYVGHPLAHDMPLDPDQASARAALGLDASKPVLALMPGSRGGEVSRIARPFLQAVKALRDHVPDLQIVAPLVNERTRDLFEREKQQCCPDLEIQVSMGTSRQALAAADVVLVASGTATLEALLSKRPMVVGYKVNGLTYALARLFKLLKVEHVAMANLLADERLAPELIQSECEPDYLLPHLVSFFSDEALRERIAQRYRKIHEDLMTDTNREAARAVIEFLRGRGIV